MRHRPQHSLKKRRKRKRTESGQIPMVMEPKGTVEPALPGTSRRAYSWECLSMVNLRCK